jgi:hypothetical protein
VLYYALLRPQVHHAQKSNALISRLFQQIEIKFPANDTTGENDQQVPSTPQITTTIGLRSRPKPPTLQSSIVFGYLFNENPTFSPPTSQAATKMLNIAEKTTRGLRIAAMSE